MIGYWPTTEETTMYRLRGYDITITDGSGANTRSLFDGARRLFECTLDGNRHREDGPAYMCLQGTSWLMVWYRHGKLHREDGPALIHPDGSLEWWQDGNPHRDNGPALVHSYGAWWHQHGKLHRDDGPALVLPEGDVVWSQNDKTHREDGPAVIRRTGSLEWWLDGSMYQTREDWLAELERRRGSC